MNAVLGARPLAGIDVHAADTQGLCGSRIRCDDGQVVALDVEGQVIQRHGTDQAQAVGLARLHCQVEVAAPWPQRAVTDPDHTSSIVSLLMHCA